jgi:hypothetical protein
MEKLLQTSNNPASEPKLKKIGAEWQAGVVWNGDEGTITTTALPLEEAPNWDSILRIWGLDPTQFRVVEPVLFNVWGNPDALLNRQWKGKVVQIADDTRKEDLSELEKEIKKHKPNLKTSFVGQGAMVVVAMANDNFTIDALSQLNHIETEICTSIERQFLKTLEGGCTAPIGALAKYNEPNDTIEFEGVLLSIDGKQKLEISKKVDISEWKKLGFSCAKEILENGGNELMIEIKKQLKK